MRLGAVEGRVALEQHDLLGRVLGQDERAAGHDRRVVLEPGQRLAVAGGVLGPDVLGQDRRLLHLRQHVGHRPLVGQHQGGRVRRGGALHVRDVARRVGRRPVLVLEDGRVGPGRVGRGQRLAVGPLGARLGVEGPDLPARALGPAAREVRHELQLRVVLDQHGIDVLERHIGVALECDERIERVDAGIAAQPEHAAVLDRAAGSPAAPSAGGRHERHGGRRRDQRGRPAAPARVPPAQVQRRLQPPGSPGKLTVAFHPPTLVPGTAPGPAPPDLPGNHLNSRLGLLIWTDASTPGAQPPPRRDLMRGLQYRSVTSDHHVCG